MKQTKKINRKKRILGIALAGLICVSSLLSLTGCNLFKTNKDTESNVNQSYMCVSDFKSSSNVKLKMYNAEADAEAQYLNPYMSATIEAIVEPEDSPNKSVDWYVEWFENKEGDGIDVLDYVTVTPNDDGSNVAIIKVLQPFWDSKVNVVCRTRLGGFTAKCLVTYVGKPTLTYFTNAESSQIYIDKSVVSLDMGKEYSFLLAPENELNAVGDYLDYEVVSVEGLGHFYVEIYRNDVVSDVSEVGWHVVDEGVLMSSFNEYMSDYITASIVNGELRLDVKKSFTAFQGYVQLPPPYSSMISDYGIVVSNSYDDRPYSATTIFPPASLNATYKARYIYDAGDCFARVTLKNTKSGLISYLDVQINYSVTGVNLDKQEIEF